METLMDGKINPLELIFTPLRLKKIFFYQVARSIHICVDVPMTQVVRLLVL